MRKVSHYVKKKVPKHFKYHHHGQSRHIVTADVGEVLTMEHRMNKDRFIPQGFFTNRSIRTKEIMEGSRKFRELTSACETRYQP